MAFQRRLQLLDCATEVKWMETAIKVAFATSDMKTVDQHFGAARSFAIYALNQDQSSIVEVIEFAQMDMDGNEDKLTGKIDAIGECSVVYSQAIGASAIRQLQSKNIRPVKVSPGADIHDLIESLQDQLRQGPSSWLAKLFEDSSPDPQRFDQMEAEGWEE